MTLAHCDIGTGQIYGCEEGSLKWWHEKGHIVFNSSPTHSAMIMIKSYIFDFWMLFLMASIIYKPLLSITASLWGAYIFITIYEEWWCNQYAKANH